MVVRREDGGDEPSEDSDSEGQMREVAEGAIPMDRCGQAVESVARAAIMLNKVWVAKHGEEGEMAVRDEDVAELVTEVNEVGKAILPDDGKWVRVSKTTKGDMANLMRGRVAMAIMAWGPIHRGNWQECKAAMGEDLWLKRLRFERDVACP